MTPPPIGPIALGEGTNTVKYAFGYIDYTVDADPGEEIVFVPGPGVLLRLFFYTISAWDDLTTNILSFTKLKNSGVGGHVDVASVDVDDGQVGVWTTVLDSSGNTFNLPNPGAAAPGIDAVVYTDVGLHIFGYQSVTGGSSTQGSGYLIAEYLSLPSTL